MSIDPREYIDKDKRLPVSLSGDARKLLAVNDTEDGYIHSEFISATDISGQIIMWPLDVPPTGYLICDGAQYNHNDYPALGTILGSLPGGQFNVPDIDLFVKNSKGAGTLTKEPEDIGIHTHNAVSNDGHTHNAVVNSAGSHRHTVNYKGQILTAPTGSGQYVASTNNVLQSSSYSGAHGHVVTNEEDGAHDHEIENNDGVINQPKCTLINFCIKT